MKRKLLSVVFAVCLVGAAGCGGQETGATESETQAVTESVAQTESETMEETEAESETEATGEKVDPTEMFVENLAKFASFKNQYEGIDDTKLVLMLQEVLQQMTKEECHIPLPAGDSEIIKVSVKTYGYDVETDYFTYNNIDYHLKLSVAYNAENDMYSIFMLTINDTPIEIYKAEDSESEIDEATEAEETETKSTSYSGGMYKIGTDMPAGEYLITTTSSYAYMQVSSDSSGELGSIVTNDNFSNRIYVTVDEGQYLQFDGTAVPAGEAPAYEPENGVYEDGVYLVGKDIPAGEYKISVSSSALGMGYIEVSSDSRGGLGSIITNNNIDSDTYQTVQDGQYLKLVGATITVQ